MKFADAAPAATSPKSPASRLIVSAVEHGKGHCAPLTLPFGLVTVAESGTDWLVLKIAVVFETVVVVGAGFTIRCAYPKVAAGEIVADPVAVPL